MHATPQRLRIEEPAALPSLQAVPPRPKLSQGMLRFLRLLRIAFWRAFVHDAFAIAKASAYSSIFTFFPVLALVGSVLANWRKGAPYLREISYALGSILPAGGNTALNYQAQRRALPARDFLCSWQHPSRWRQYCAELPEGSAQASL